jgi:hypothetical protein
MVGAGFGVGFVTLLTTGFVAGFLFSSLQNLAV